MALLQSGLAKSLAEAYTIDQSLRFEPADDPMLSRTPAVAGNRRTWTMSLWVKRCRLDYSSDIRLFEAGTDGSNTTWCGFPGTGTGAPADINVFAFEDYSSGHDFQLYTTNTYRDPAAWYHYVIRVDTTQVTASDRIRIYVNGEDTTDFNRSDYPDQDEEFHINNTDHHEFGASAMFGGEAVDAYLAEVYMIDGQSLAPSSFGETDSATNQWKPIDSETVVAAVTFGTNGFYQKYAATTLAKSFTDSSTSSPYSSEIKLLLHMDGANDGTTFPDSSRSEHTVTANGGVHTDTAVKKFGTASAQFDGTTDYLSIASTSDFAIGTGDFTMELWVYHTASGSSENIIDLRDDTNGYKFDIDSSNLVGFYSEKGAYHIKTSALSEDTWYHVAVVRLDGVMYLYLDGVYQSTIADTYDYSTSLPAIIGARMNAPSGGQEWTGYMDELRHIKGTAVYTTKTGNFTPPSAAFANPTHAITGVGDVTNTRAQSKVGDSSIYFDGTGDYLSIPPSSDFSFGTGAYTVEAWIMLSSSAAVVDFIWESRSGQSNGFYFLVRATGMLEAGDASGVIQTGDVLSDDTWTHVALVREGTGTNEAQIYVAGTSRVTGTLSTTISGTDADNIFIGSGPTEPEHEFYGWMDEIRVSDSARYTGTYTPSTTEFTTDSNTMLLIHSNWDGGLGADSSGNENDFTVTNLVATDQMKDSPTNNFATLNPLYVNSTSSVSFAEGNLFWEQTSAAHTPAASTIAVGSDKWYFECKAIAGDATKWWYGMADAASIYNVSSGNLLWGELSSGTFGGDNIAAYSDKIDKDGSTVQADIFGTNIAANDICMVAMDCDNGKVWFGRNGTWNNGDPGNSSGRQSTTLNTSYEDTTFDVTRDYYMGVGAENSEWYVNYGQDSSFAGTSTAQGNADGNEIGDFYYAVPANHLALCTSNLSAPSIALPGDYFNTVLYTGEGYPTAVTGVGFQPDFVWIKRRNAATRHDLYDAVRGGDFILESSSTRAENEVTGSLTFDSDGFTAAVDPSYGDTGSSGNTFVAWNWLAGGTPTATNTATDGVMTSGSVFQNGVSNTSFTPGSTIYPEKISANTTNGFSIVEYDGNATSGATVAHGLSQAPELYVLHSLDIVNSWMMYADPLGSNNRFIQLNETGGYYGNTDRWNDTSPTASLFSLGNSTAVNTSGEPYIVYCFHSVEGYSKVGSYEGNGDADGSFTYTGFRPAFVMTKSIDSTSDWQMFDNKRVGYNVDNYELEANDTATEDTSTEFIDIVSNGFKNRIATDPNVAETYLYIAFAESPFKYANAR